MPASSPLRFLRFHHRPVAIVLATTACALVSRAAHAQWQPEGLPVCTQPGNQVEPAASLPGDVYFAWSDNRSSPSRIFAQRLDHNGIPQWSAGGIAVATAASGQYSPRIVGDGNLGIIVSWVEGTSIRAQRLAMDGIAQWGAAGVAIAQGTTPKLLVGMIPDGSFSTTSATGAVILWTADNGGPNTPLRQLYAQSVTGAGAARWAAGGVLVSAADCGNPAIISDGTGLVTVPKGMFIAWSQSSVSNADIYAQRLNGAGTPFWTSGGIPVTSIHTAIAPSLVRTGTPAAIVTWEDSRNGSEDVYAQQLTSTGVGWIADGLPVCRATGPQQDSQLVSDGAGGAIVAWTDDRDQATLGADVYAQRINSSGVPQWSLDGIPVCNAAGDQRLQAVTVDGANGMVLVWADANGLETQRLSSGGGIQWPAGGVGVAKSAHPEDSPALLPDGAGGAYVAWEDFRSTTNYDIYASHVSDQGTIAAVGTAPAAGAWLSAPSPNPASRGTTIDFVLPAEEPVSAAVYDVDGALVRTLEHAQETPAGRGELRWDGRDSRDVLVPSGIYFLRFEAGTDVEMRRLVTMH